MGKSNKIVPQSMCNWLLMMVFLMQFVVSLFAKNIWEIISYKPLEQHYYILIVEVFAVALPMFLLCTFNKSGFVKTFCIKKIKFSKVRKCVCLGICLQPVAVVANYVWQIVLDIESQTTYSVVPSDAKNFIIIFLCTCIVPAFCEEFLLRGMYLSSVKRKGYGFAISASTIMFVLMHSDVSLLMAHAILGIATAFVVLNTNSVFSGILLHVSFNLGGIFTDVIAKNFEGFGDFGVHVLIGVAGLSCRTMPIFFLRAWRVRLRVSLPSTRI